MKKEKDRKFNKSDLNLFSVVGNNPTVTSERGGRSSNETVTPPVSGCEALLTRRWSHGQRPPHRQECFFSIKHRWKPSRWWATSALQACSSWAQWEDRLHTAVMRMRRAVSGPAGHDSILHDPSLSPTALLPWKQPLSRFSFLFTLRRIHSLATY